VVGTIAGAQSGANIFSYAVQKNLEIDKKFIHVFSESSVFKDRRVDFYEISNL
jgi:hypothetical protein